MTDRLQTVIETERLVLRVPSLREFDAWAQFMADERAARFIGRAQTPPAVWRSIATIAGSWLLTGSGMFSVFVKSTGQWVGRVGPWQTHGWPGTEVGWGLVREVWGKGYAYEASVASMDYAVDVLGWTDIIHAIHPENVRSRKLAERLGSINRGAGRLPEPYDTEPVDLWGQTAAEWRARRTRPAAGSQ